MGRVIKQIDYDTFGNIINETNEAFKVPFGFAGGLHDRDTGLVRFGYRDFDPDTGKWTAKDPIGFNGGDTNLYGYVLNDPVNWIDPEGLYRRCKRGLKFKNSPVVGRLYHDHFIDDNGNNFGYFNDENGGSVSSDPDFGSRSGEYQCGFQDYNNKIIDEIKGEIEDDWIGKYDLVNNNCQDFTDEIIKIYELRTNPYYQFRFKRRLNRF